MAFAISTELASSAAAAASNSACRPPRAAFVAAEARWTCSPRSALRPVRRSAALVAEVAVPAIEPGIAWVIEELMLQPTARRATVATPPASRIHCLFIALLLSYKSLATTCRGYLTRISPRMDWWRSQKYVYVPALEKVKLKVVPLPGSGVLNWPSRFSGVPEVTVCVMSSALAQVTRVPAFTSMGVGLN